MNKPLQRAFTLTELLVVGVIFGILVAAAVPQLRDTADSVDAEDSAGLVIAIDSLDSGLDSTADSSSTANLPAAVTVLAADSTASSVVSSTGSLNCVDAAALNPTRVGTEVYYGGDNVPDRQANPGACYLQRYSEATGTGRGGVHFTSASLD